jgi:hypothetical protein
LERRLSLLFGIIGGLFLVTLNRLSMPFAGYVTDLLFNILGLIGIIAIIYFSFLLIIDTLKMIHKR